MPSSALLSARMSYAAAVIGCVTYGIYFVLAVISIRFLLKRRTAGKQYAHRIILAYTVLMLVVSTGYFVCAAIWSEVEFVESTNDISVYDTLVNSPLAILKDTFYVVNIWLADSLLLYRTFVTWGGSYLIIIVPTCLWAGAVATGIALLVDTARPLANLDQGPIIHFQTAFYCLSISLNILCTLSIAGKLWMQHRRVQALRAASSWSYTSIIAIVVESAALYSVCGIIYIPLIVRSLPLQFPVTALVGSLTSIAPTLIILRIALISLTPGGTTATDSTVITLSRLRTGRSGGAIAVAVDNLPTGSGTSVTEYGGSKSRVTRVGDTWSEDNTKLPTVDTRGVSVV
ncbi:hypothetical protein GY45DRAFT_1263186 [Cubamyces sp. BRFM 1775]|nr:hypothetical protein GY45DRAFT_1263186 [Cubamyces sp. BRFM 1775]